MIKIDEDRPWLKGFNTYYSSDIAPLVEDIAASRDAAAREIKRRTKILLGAGAPVTIGLLLLSSDLSIFSALAGVGAYLYWARKPAREFGNEYKKEVVHRLGKFFGFEYNPSPNSARLNSFELLKLIPYHSAATFEDELRGMHEHVDIKFVEAHLEAKQLINRPSLHELRQLKNFRIRDLERLGKRGGQQLGNLGGFNFGDLNDDDDLVSVYDGPLIVVDFPKPFSGQTRVNSSWSAADKTLIGSVSNEERIRLEDPVFEKKFPVHSTDQIEARYILTPDFMERILQLEKLLGGNIQVGFINKQMLISANGGKDHFEAGTVDYNVDPHKPIVDSVNEISAIFDLIEN